MTGRAEQGRRGGWRLAAWATAAALLLAPPLILELVDEAAGDPGDFVFAAILLAMATLVFETAARIPRRAAYAAGCGVALLAAAALAWINLAVGILGGEDDPANLMYVAVPAVGLAGAALARFRPAGMDWALVAAALAQVAVFGAALAAGFGFTGPITVFFCALWLTSAWLFRRAAGAPVGASS